MRESSAVFSRDALQWLWAYTLELRPAALARRTPGARRRRGTRSAARPAAGAPVGAAPPAGGARPDDRAAAAAPEVRALDALHDAPASAVRRGVRAALDRLAAGACSAAVARAASARIEGLAQRHGGLDALLVEAAVLRGALDDALQRLGALLAAHTPRLADVQAMGEAGHVRRMRSDPVLSALYKACRAVLVAAQRRVDAEQAAGTDAPTAAAVCAWLWAHPLAMALAQPVFPKVCQAIYTIVAALRDPAAHVAALRTSLDAPRAARAAGLVAVALANRGAAETGARVVLDAEHAGVRVSERAVRRVLRVLVEAHGRRVVIAPLVALLDARGPATRRRAGTPRAPRSASRARAAGGDTRVLERHTALLVAAHAGDVGGVAQLYAAAHGQALEAAYADATAREVGVYVYHLLRAYAQRDDLPGARAALAAYAAHRRVSESMCHVLLALSARYAHADAALHLVAEMDAAQVRVGRATLAHLVRALGAAHLPERAASVVQYYAARGVALDRRVYAALLDAYVEAGHWSAVFGTFRWMQAQPRAALRPDAAAYTTMLKAHILHGTPVHHVLRLLHTMRRHGLVPDERAYALVLQSACDAHQLALAESLFALLDTALAPTLGGATRHHYTILLHALLRAGDVRRARHYVDRMRAAGIEPSHVTYGVLLRAYADADESAAPARALALQLTDEADAAPDDARPADAAPFEDLLVPLIRAHGRRGELDAAARLFARLRDAAAPHAPSLRAWTALLNAHRYASDVRGVLRTWDELYLATLERAAPHGAPAPGSAQPSALCLPLSVVITALAEAGHFRRIAAIWARVQRDGFAFDAQNFNHLAAALARAGRVREALEVVEHVLPQRPPALEAATYAPRLRRRPLHTPAPPPTPPAYTDADAPWQPRTLPPRRRLRAHRSSRAPAADADAPSTRAAHDALLGPTDARRTERDIDPAPWLDRALLAPPHVWYASYDTLREICAAIDRQRGTPRRTRRAPAAHPRAAGASALALPTAPPESITEALHAFPTAAARLAEYEQRAALWDALDP
ncbi:hypothetical protein MOBT1_002441 [Malassezia obtusa]|uniref:Pentatricopeptide repeat-containing protein-mitochondrial domain-containing protein n=1 Tax=Malassezia obtusa TaxID=76774 RepID=A0AAF0E563_9BASI|nr:hypothetical protein MOBT1_002441 [Malassezia obtusa]